MMCENNRPSINRRHYEPNSGCSTQSLNAVYKDTLHSSDVIEATPPSMNSDCNFFKDEGNPGRRHVDLAFTGKYSALNFPTL